MGLLGRSAKRVQPAKALVNLLERWEVTQYRLLKTKSIVAYLEGALSLRGTTPFALKNALLK